MLVFFKQNLAFLSVPKTGSTAYELALRPRADVIFTKRVKHMTIGKYHAKMAPFLKETYGITPERMAVVRDPIDHARSWYKYRSPHRMAPSNPACHGGISFDDFLLDAISDTPSKPAGIGSQASFLSLGVGDVPVHHLFAYEHQDLLQAFLLERFGRPIVPQQKNVSPDVDAPVSPEVAEKFRAARPADFTLYDRVMQAGGVLREFQGQ
ncbi:hypothetical protein J7382_10470 [Shimia sp. R11_0]|uniref:hypothetical protein n=1 Tax=Shimia sp. R11_0 TaxID=2821096 RepID=UPI001ADA2DF6|nr:hypothetical protein [Shimia sp. R11_0]MBO9477959.1 hypothetical protein [Shimia sp. R11_0]